MPNHDDTRPDLRPERADPEKDYRQFSQVNAPFGTGCDFCGGIIQKDDPCIEQRSRGYHAQMCPYCITGIVQLLGGGHVDEPAAETDRVFLHQCDRGDWLYLEAGTHRAKYFTAEEAAKLNATHHRPLYVEVPVDALAAGQVVGDFDWAALQQLRKRSE